MIPSSSITSVSYTITLANKGHREIQQNHSARKGETYLTMVFVE